MCTWRDMPGPAGTSTAPNPLPPVTIAQLACNKCFGHMHHSNNKYFCIIQRSCNNSSVSGTDHAMARTEVLRLAVEAPIATVHVLNGTFGRIVQRAPAPVTWYVMVGAHNHCCSGVSCFGADLAATASDAIALMNCIAVTSTSTIRYCRVDE